MRSVTDPGLTTGSAAGVVSPGGPLLATKLYAPRVRSGLVTRPRLVERLNEGVEGRLIVVSAPAGFGKTTLLGEWRAQSPLRVAWISLDEGDDHPARFLAYLSAALEGLRLGVGALPAALRADRVPVEPILAALVNEVVAIPEDFVLVLDDYHRIGARPVHDAVAFLLEHLPPQARLVISGRVDPPLPLARLLASGDLARISAADLKFAPDETVSFINRVMDLGLSGRDVEKLEERTEGWIAGLQLAAHAMRGRDDASGFVADFAGSHRYVLDYLAEEVLQKQPEEIRSFLLETSILGRLCGPLCDAVTGGEGGQEMLEELERTNLFLVPLDDERRWFRYHHLFSEFLIKQLRRARPEGVPELHHRACGWFEGEALAGEAVGHALAAGEEERAASLVERNARRTLRRGELNTLYGWLKALPEPLIYANPRLCLFYAWHSLAAGRIAEIEAYLERTEASSAADAGVRAEATVIRTAVAGLMGEKARAAVLAREAEALLTEENLFLRAILAAGLGFGHRAGGEVEAAADRFSEAAGIGQSSGSTYVALLALKHLAELRVVQGRLQAAAGVCRRALELAAESEAGRLPAASAAHVGMGDLLREWGELDEAARHLEAGVELAGRGGNTEIALDGLAALSRVEQARGDWDAAAAALHEAARLALKPGGAAAGWTSRVRAWQARLWTARGDAGAAAGWLKECGLSVEDGLSYAREPEHVVLARALISRNRPEEALRLLERLHAAAEAGGRYGRVVEVQALRALALAAEGDASGALVPLRQALSLAEPEGYVRTFADEGAPMAVLLKRLLATREISGEDHTGDERDRSEYVRRLLVALGEEAGAPAGALVEPLSGRELEVLGLLASGISNKEIAKRLFVSPDTVKTHLRHVYGKLDASNRTRAVARARELGLI